MKSYKRIIHILGIFLLFSFLGCQENLDVINPNQMTTDQFWKTEADAEAAMVSLYATIGLGEWSEQWDFNEHYFLLNEIRTDMGRWLGWGLLVEMSQYTYSTTKYLIRNAFKWQYRIIFTANQILENIDAVEDMDASKKAVIIGEAKFARAHANFHLLKNWGAVPLVTENAKTPDDFYKPRATEAEMWAQIENDLKDAKAALPASWEDKWLGRVTKGAAAAYLGKVYLFQEKWAEAETEFKAVTGMGYGLETDYWSLFTGLNEHSEESIWEINFSADETGGRVESNSMPAHFRAKNKFLSEWGKELFLTDTAANGAFSQRFYASVLYDDPGCDVYHWNGKTYKEVYGDDETRMFYKKWVVSRDDWPSPSKSDVNFYIFRYSDVLLMLAEALNEQGKTTEAVPYVNQVRQRAGSKLIGPLNQTQLREHIRHVERPLEFLSEATRVEDLHRWYGFGKDGGMKALLLSHNKLGAENFRDGISELYPLPQIEIDANPELVQNPGY